MPADRSSTLYKDKGARKGAFVISLLCIFYPKRSREELF